MQIPLSSEDGNVYRIMADNYITGNHFQKKEKFIQSFFATNPTASGIGLVLSLSYDVVKVHGGELTVNSKVNEGTEFIIQIPIH